MIETASVTYGCRLKHSYLQISKSDQKIFVSYTIYRFHLLVYRPFSREIKTYLDIHHKYIESLIDSNQQSTDCQQYLPE